METVITRESLIDLLYDPNNMVYNSNGVLVGPAQEDDYNYPYYAVTVYTNNEYLYVHIQYPLESNKELEEYSDMN